MCFCDEFFYIGVNKLVIENVYYITIIENKITLIMYIQVQ